jgi:hypothetical protein
LEKGAAITTASEREKLFREIGWNRKPERREGGTTRVENIYPTCFQNVPPLATVKLRRIIVKFAR